MPLDMRNESVEARHDLAYAMRTRGFPPDFIQKQLGYTSLSGVYHSIKKGRARAESNECRISPRSFGVEIEFNGCPPANVIRVLRAVDPSFPVDQQDYNHRVQPLWKLTTDASVNATGTTGEDDNDDYGNGLEMVSPILTGRVGFDQLKTVVEAIRRAGGKVDSSCGLHVHHDARDMSPNQLAYLVEFYIRNQKTIDHFVARSRRSGGGGSWCHAWSGREIDSVLAACKSRGDLSQSSWSRYRSINVTSYPKYGSIEFRQHHGSLNLQKITAWVHFGQSMMEAAIKCEGQPVKVFDPEDYEGLVAWLSQNGLLRKSSAAYLIRRANEYATGNVDGLE